MGGWGWPTARLDTTAFFRALTFQGPHRTYTVTRHEDKCEEGVRAGPDHAELAPGCANGPVLHHDVCVRFGLFGLRV